MYEKSPRVGAFLYFNGISELFASVSLGEKMFFVFLFFGVKVKTECLSADLHQLFQIVLIKQYHLQANDRFERTDLNYRTVPETVSVTLPGIMEVEPSGFCSKLAAGTVTTPATVANSPVSSSYEYSVGAARAAPSS